jgi:hypothetical protein
MRTQSASKLMNLSRPWAAGLYALLDTICVGVGMGVPIFCIALGLPVGWYIARRASGQALPMAATLRAVLKNAALSAGWTFVLMLAIWTPTARMLFDPRADLAHFGIPLILYDPRASFIGWLALMILISPFLQLLTTLFAAHVTIAWTRPAPA